MAYFIIYMVQGLFILAAKQQSGEKKMENEFNLCVVFVGGVVPDRLMARRKLEFCHMGTFQFYIAFF